MHSHSMFHSLGDVISLRLSSPRATSLQYIVNDYILRMDFDKGIIIIFNQSLTSKPFKSRNVVCSFF